MTEQEINKKTTTEEGIRVETLEELKALVNELRWKVQTLTDMERENLKKVTDLCQRHEVAPPYWQDEKDGLIKIIDAQTKEVEHLKRALTQILEHLRTSYMLHSIRVIAEGALQNYDKPPMSREILDTDVQEFFSNLPDKRPLNCLRHGNIRYIGELLQREEKQMYRLRGLGRGSLKVIKERLKEDNLYIGMDVGDWKSPDERKN